jgi:hypothetical protein
VLGIASPILTEPPSVQIQDLLQPVWWQIEEVPLYILIGSAQFLTEPFRFFDMLKRRAETAIVATITVVSAPALTTILVSNHLSAEQSF